MQAMEEQMQQELEQLRAESQQKLEGVGQHEDLEEEDGMDGQARETADMDDTDAGGGYLAATASNDHLLHSSHLRDSEPRDIPLGTSHIRQASSSTKINIQENHTTQPISQKPSQKSMRKGKAIKFQENTETDY